MASQRYHQKQNYQRQYSYKMLVNSLVSMSMTKNFCIIVVFVILQLLCTHCKAEASFVFSFAPILGQQTNERVHSGRAGGLSHDRSSSSYHHHDNNLRAMTRQSRDTSTLDNSKAPAHQPASDRLINLSSLNVSLNHNKLKGYKLRQLFSKISINGSEPLIEQNNISNYSDLTTATPKDRNKIEVISVDLKDVDIPFTLPPTTMESALKLLVPSTNQVKTSDSNNGEEGDSAQQQHSIKFSQNHLTMTGVNLKLLNMQLYKEEKPKCDLQFTIGNTTVNGRFSFNTQLMLMDIQLEGRYVMQVDDVYVKATTQFVKELGIEQRGPMLKTKDLDLNITSMGRINLNLYNDNEDGENGSGNSYWFRLLNRVLHKTIKRTYYTFENEIKESLEDASRKSLDDELIHLMPYLSYNTSQQQDLVASVRQEMINSNYVTTKLPDHQHSTHLLGLEAKIFFSNGLLSGLDTLKITGDSKIKIQDLHLLVNTSIGWSELVATYDWRLNLGIKGKVKFSIKEVAFDAVIIKRLFPTSKLTLEELNVTKLESVKMDLSGLPGLNTATKSAVNFFMRHMKKRLVDSVQPILKNELEKTLQGMRLFEL